MESSIHSWKQFLVAKKRMLNEFDIARERSKAHEVETYHGRVAESQFRQWLSSFLPQKYGVTSGYILSQRPDKNTRAPHFDVIIYDQLESPVLWKEDNPDTTGIGFSRAIPAEHVRAVIEVKSALNPKSAKLAVKHLCDLENLLVNTDEASERYKKYLPQNFFSAVVFFELRESDQSKHLCLSNLLPSKFLRGYYGGIVLRGDNLPVELSGRIKMGVSETPFQSSWKEKKHSLLDPSLGLDTSTIEYSPNHHYSLFMNWNHIEFASFAFDMVAILNGTYDPRFLSSFHGFAWGDEVNSKK